MVLAQAFVALPFLVSCDRRHSSRTRCALRKSSCKFGRRSVDCAKKITLPLAAPGLLAGTILCFARALGEFGATALFAGNAPGVTQTMPLAIYTAFNGGGVGRGPAVALSLLLLFTALLVLLLVTAWRPGALK